MRIPLQIMKIRSHLQPINAHPILGNGQHGKVYGRVPDLFSTLCPRANMRRERVGNERLHQDWIQEFGKGEKCTHNHSQITPILGEKRNDDFSQ